MNCEVLMIRHDAALRKDAIYLIASALVSSINLYVFKFKQHNILLYITYNRACAG